MNIILARTFLELVNTRNFNKAADRLCVTQSTVTVRIAALEDQLGQQLFIRDKAGVELTVAGRKFRPFAEQLLQTWQHAKQELALSSAQSVMFSIGIGSALWGGLGMPWLLDVQRSHPNIALSIDIGTSESVLERISQGFLDAAVILDASPRRDVIIEELLDEQLILVSTYPRKAERWNPDYVYVNWGEDFKTQHRAIMPTDITPPVSFTSHRGSLEFILARGGSAYFPLRQVGDLINQRKLFCVEDARPMTQRLYFAYTEAVSRQDWFEDLHHGLRNRVAEIAAADSRFVAQKSPLQSERV